MTAQPVTLDGGWTGFRAVDGDGADRDAATADLITILDTVEVPIVVMRRDFVIAGFNRAAAGVLEFSRSDIGRAFRDIPLLAGSPRLEQQCSEVIAGGVESRADVPDGERWFVVRISPYRQGEREVAGTVLTFTNVTAFRASTSQAIYERECTKAILNTVADPLVVLSADQRIQSGNRAFYAMFGISRDETQGAPLSDLGNGAFELAPLRKQLRKLLAGSHNFQPLEVDQVTTASGQRTLVLAAHPLSFPGHAERRVLVTFQDITARKHAEAAKDLRSEEELRRSEAFLAEGQRLSLTGSFSWKVATDEITWSEQLYRIYELETGVPVTLDLVRTRVHPEDVSLIEKLKLIDRRQDGGTDVEWQYRLVMPDRSIKYLHAVAHAARDNDGQLEYIAAVQDVTARRMSDQELQRVAAEQQALRKAAMLVASGAPPTEVFAAISESAAEVFGVPFASLIRVGPDETATMVAACEACSAYVGQSWTVPAGDPGITRTVLDSCRPSRIEDHSRVHGPVGEAARELGVGSVVGAPVIVDGSVWGVLAVGAAQSGPPLASDAADRLANFAELVSTAIVNTEARDQVRRLLDEQAALRRVATLVARGVSPADLFAAVCDEATELFDTEMAAVGRFEADEPALVTVGLSAGVRGMTIGMRTELGDWLASTAVHLTGRTARRDVTAEEITGKGPIADAVRAMGFLSTVSAPIVVEGRLWGVMTVSDSRHALSPDTEKRIENFTELIATAIANREARDQVTSLLDEQSALRRVATLVAESPVSEELFSAVAREVAGVLHVSGVLVERFEPDGSVLTLGAEYDADLHGADAFFAVGTVMPRDPGSLAAQVFETRRTARVDDYSRLPGTIGDAARAAGLGSGVAGPILVDGKLWGQMCVFSRGGTLLPVGAESQLHDFIELAATAISNYEAHAALQRLAEEQAALQRIATLVAEGATPNQVFDAVRHEVARMFDIPSTVLMRFDADGMGTLLATYGYYLGAVGTRWPLEGDTSAVARVHQTGRAARADYTRHVHGSLAQAAQRGGVRYPVAVPVVVEGALWGAMSAGSYGPAPPPPDLEARLAKFTELLATAIANAESRAELAASEARAQELANEQAALRRVATLVAKGVAPGEVFASVAEEVAVLFDRPWVGVMRYDSDASFSVVATWGEHPFPPGSRWPLDGPSTPESVLRTGRPARISDYTGLPGTVAEASRNAGIVGGIGAPIIVEGITWGMIAAPMTADRPIPDGAEVRLNLFTELVATAIANAETRAELAASEARALELAREQAALRRVATLVAQGASADELFAAVAYEVASVVDVPVVGLCRYEPDRTFTMLGIAGETTFTVGSRWPVEDQGLAGMILATGCPTRKDDYSTMPGPLGAAVRDDRMVATLGVPIVVEGGIWGFMVAAGRPGQPIPAGTEERLARFTELVATAMSNATMRGELVASRARVIAAADDARRRIERNLHDGAQQQLVTLALAMRSTEGRVPTGQEQLKAEVGGFADRLTSVVAELREMSRGIHPAVLSEGGLSPALEALALRSAVPVKLDVRHEQRLPDAVEVAAYYVASEALTNAAKHADASRVEIDLHLEDTSLRLSIRDDGGGGADPSQGTGLVGLKDRVEALGGTIDVESPHGRGTQLQVAIPVLANSSAG